MPAITRPILTPAPDERGVRDGSSPRETFAPGEVAATRRFFVSWAQRYDALRYFCGYSLIEPVAGGGAGRARLRRLTPQKLPDSGDVVPDNPAVTNFLWATRLNVVSGHRFNAKRTAQPDGAIGSSFDLVEVEVGYERLPYMVRDDTGFDPYNGADNNEHLRFVSIGEWQMSADYISLPGGLLSYYGPLGTEGGHAQPIQFNVGKVLPIFEIPMTWHRLPEGIIDYRTGTSRWLDRIFGTASERTYIGTVNKTDFLTFPAGTLLLVGVQPRCRPSLTNHPDFEIGLEYDVEFKFAFDPFRHNFKYYHPPVAAGATGAGWYFAGRTQYRTEGSIPDNDALFDERDFADLFKVGANA